jgi:hypothetical protein
MKIMKKFILYFLSPFTLASFALADALPALPANEQEAKQALIKLYRIPPGARIQGFYVMQRRLEKKSIKPI